MVDPALVVALRDDLRAAEFTVDGVAARLGPVASAALHREQAVPAALATADAADACAVLVSLFTLGRPVARAAVDAALPSVGVAGAERLGLLAPVESVAPDDADGAQAADVVLAACDLRPYADDAHDWWVASDLSEVQTGEVLRPDHVLGIGGASTTLAAWTVRRPTERALDLGTGCGVQALHLSTHAASVTATDLSTRALEFARFNAALNATEMRLLQGDMLEPVATQRFSLVVSNPPFVITPRDDEMPLYEYRDGGRAGDAIVRSLVREVGDVLEPGGVAQFLGNWEVPAGAEWTDVWERWLDGVGLDAWVVQRETQDPAQYAELWSRDAGIVGDESARARTYAAWLRDFESRDVAAIGFGVVMLQRPLTDRPPWRDLTEVLGPVAAALGPTVEAGVAARTWLAEHDDDAVLDVAWSCAADVTEERHGRPGAEHPSVILVRQGGGLRRVRRADTLLAGYLGVADGSLTARVALDAIAEIVGAGADQVRAEVLPRLRELVADGILV